MANRVSRDGDDYLDAGEVDQIEFVNDSPLSEERIVAAARVLMESSGIESVTMRRVASALGVTAMALYHHVADKQALVALVADHLIGAAPEPPCHGPWYDRLREGFLAVHGEISGYPGVGLHISGARRFYPSGLRKFESTVQLLVDAGFDRDEAIEANYLLLAYESGYFLMEKSVARAAGAAKSEDAGDGENDPDPKAAMTSSRAFLKGLDTIISGFRAQLAAKQVLVKASHGKAADG